MILKLVFLSLLTFSPCISIAEDSAVDSLQQFENQNREFQLKIENSRLERLKRETELLKNEEEFHRGDAEFERLRLQYEAYKAARIQEELTNRAEQAAQEQEEATQKAQDAADEIQSQLLQSEVRHKNQLFLGVVMFTITITLFSVVNKYRKERYMKDFEKFGIVIIFISGLLILLALMISVFWDPRLDFIQNLMTSLQIKLFNTDEVCNSQYIICESLIDFPTKYAVLTLLALASYGFTTYLGITPPFKWKK